jgi:LDH2 family malate/lactate/ureidoglycolate dehydrogenase
MPQEHASLTAEAVCSASLRGVDSHGIRLLPHYLSALKSGRIRPDAVFSFDKKTPSAAVFDADHGMAHAAMAIAMDRAIELAEVTGVGLVSVKNSNHCGEMAFYGLRAAKRDMIGLALTNTTPKLKVHNAAEPFFGTNPLCFTAPMMNEDPFCFDASPAVMSSNKIKMFGRLGKTLPDDVATDIAGIVTNNPALVKMLLPLGGIIAGYKGFGLSMIVDILSSLLSGMPAGKDISAMYESDGGIITEPRYLGQFVAAIRIDVFVDLQVFKERLTEIAWKIRSLKPVPEAAEDVMIPGDPEKRISKERGKKGIPLSPELYSELFKEM